ncbi:MAG TPA: N-6 DNA methylase, partial [Ktedonobacteraceae bacterium]|nr:N-6 DNA methylase [Ktedonobacteraceae bacterium]
TGCPGLGLPALNGFLFSQRAVPDLVGCELANHELLNAVRSLAFTYDGHIRRSVDYKNLGSEELGSIYESLLELHPELNVEAATFVLKTASGNERKTSGSYYTPSSLIDCLLDSALEPVLAEASAKPDPEKAILNLKVCDPACGSGHFLIAAAHRIAKRLAAVRTGTEEPGPEPRRAALRDVVGHCIYGVDINPMAVELCKVNLWMEAIEPGKPLSFLDAHIQCGNSLLGATPSLLKQGIPDSAFEPIEGDDKKICSEYKKKNKVQRAGQLSLFTEDLQPWDRLGDLATSIMQMENMRDDTVEEIHRKQDYYAQFVASSDYLNGRLRADAWCAAFVWKKTKDFAYPITEEIFRKIEQNPYNIASWMKDEIQRLAQQYQFFHWHLAFPDVFRIPATDEMPENEQTGWVGGFDVVLGNPPWERIKMQEKEWFASHRPDIANAANTAQRRKMISELVHEAPELYEVFKEDQRQATGESHIIRDSDRYPLCGRGDVNTYAVFAENMRLVVSSHGRVGAIVPSGIATDDTTKFFFQNLMETQSLASLYSFENREKLFPAVDSRYSFCLLTLAGPSRPIEKGAEFVFFAQKVEDLQDDQRRFLLNIRDISLLNPNTKTCPIFRSKHDAELNLAIYKRVPVLINEQTEINAWSAYYMRLIHLSDHAAYLHFPWEIRDPDWNIPLYEAKLFLAFDHRFSTFADLNRERCIAGQPREFSNIEKNNPSMHTSPRYFLPKKFTQDLFAKYPDYKRSCLLVWRDVARSTDERTCIATIIPKVPASVKCPALGLNASTTPTHLLANLNSFLFDYAARQKVGSISLSFFIFKQLPAFPPDQYKKASQWHNAISLG